VSQVAVLGGTGWVGRHVCATFAEHGYGVVAVARNPAPHTANYRFHALDLASASTETIAELFRSERIDVVVNATDSTNTTDGWDRTDEEHDLVNVAMVGRVLAALPGGARVVHLGTIHEYGPVAHRTAITESQPTNPTNSYARSKLAGSTAVLDSGAGVVLRLVNLCGPHPSPDSFPGKLVGLLRSGGAVTITAAQRDFVDVRDVAAAVLAAAEATAAGQVVNIGSGAPVEIHELVRVLVAEAGFPPDRLAVHSGPVSSVGGDWIQADITLAEKVLGWRPRIGLRESLRDMWHCAGG
jgi:nucleoside-diphosphate-sugar epimerase